MFRATAALLILFATPLSAQMHTMHASGGMYPMEPGQGAFAAIAEIVAMLRADPDTDWSKVRIDDLQAHLADMDLLMTGLEVASHPVTDGIAMEIPLDGAAGGAAGRMVPAHAPVLAEETGWASTVVRSDGALTWTVTSARDVAMVRALGFYGLMAVGDHHREHHLAIASGRPMH